MSRDRTDPPLGRPGRRLLASLALIGATLLTACNGPGKALHNLRELHATDGEIRPQARLVSGFQYRWKTLFGSEFESAPDGDPKVRVARPQKRALNELLTLADYEGRNRRLATARIEVCALLATASRSQLVRERAIRVLGDVARDLDLPSIVQLPTGAAEGSTTDDRSLVQSVAARLAAADDTAAMEAALEAAAGLELDLEGARALLRQVGELRGPAVRGAEEPLDALTLALERRCVALALGLAVRDPREWVRAAAVEEALTFDPSLTHEILSAAIESQALRLIEVCMRHLASVGPSEDHPQEAWFELAVRALDQGVNFQDGPVIVASCAALTRLAPVQLETLRAEEWLMWFEDYRAGVPAPGVDR
ncbi:hypothetical protein [Engelhardtia mirabilis]|uniref:Uncharacterized protein n=1 Tax=Engelhardtia mirabilis TaxID=2528011 RepID=A0A518BKM5_9BACT|nr:hypothetical protein Pla133_26080 [Planctomycetes bacterium Pla133]QDV01847.1 hypothetical protein Pla86_26070 [Planctomycetes bacterium Pla86]